MISLIAAPASPRSCLESLPKKRYTAEDIIHKLREVDVLPTQSCSVARVCKQLGIVDKTYYRWRKNFGHSERRICIALGISRNTVRYEPQPRDDGAALTGSIIRLAGQYGRCGYRRIHALLRTQG